MKRLNLQLAAFAALALLLSCGQNTKKENGVVEPATETVEAEPIYDTSKPETVLTSIAHAHGGWGDLWKKGDVEYTYTYHSPGNDKKDISLERYIFSTEASYGKYSQHEINVMPNVEGEIEQYYDGDQTIVMINGEKTEDPQGNAVGEFLRRANHFWFVMPYKLRDKGTITTYQGQEEHNGITYDKLHVTYDPAITGKEQNDIYILYVNPETRLIDRFYFSLPFLGVNEPVIIADYSYENIDGQLISSKRTYYLPSEEGYSEDPSIVQTMTNVKFGNGFTAETLMQ
ncbi:hypothetical protein M3P19_01200 [Muricauda sp. 2012CJ35-5]|uniref:Lipoprotein n=1 Tax=Flagellimonas spongiicola TaxID=2942208 RepID=A0ABT0PMI7_9FLAO|nr:DUF6503 family protein [Allomuricauda spongiicola]MCL6272600.1 hypothetical protein [Allomuricauda spongiicola]